MTRVHCVALEQRPPQPRKQTGREGALIIPQSYGGHSEGETPGPIPNPEAKPFSADGTAPATVWESRTPPDNIPRGGHLRFNSQVTSSGFLAFRENGCLD